MAPNLTLTGSPPIIAGLLIQIRWRRAAREQCPGVGAQSLGAGLEEILSIALFEIFNTRDRRFRRAEHLAELFLGEAAGEPPIADEMAASTRWVTYSGRHWLRLLLT
jgi:hypothetical protein